MEMADAKRFKELESENTELKKMLADEMLKARVLEEALKKNMNGLREAAGSGAGRRKGCLFGTQSVPLPESTPLQLRVPSARGQ